MDIIKEVGAFKILKYLIFTLWEAVFHVLLFSPLRVWWMRLGGTKIGKNPVIGNLYFMNLYRRGLPGLTVGNNCFIGNRVVFDLADEIEIGTEVTLSDEVFLLTHTNVGYKNHPLQKFFPNYSKKIVMQNGVFVGIRATIFPGVTLGEESAVGACSLVTKDVPARELHAGVPAKLIRQFS